MALLGELDINTKPGAAALTTLQSAFSSTVGSLAKVGLAFQGLGSLLTPLTGALGHFSETLNMSKQLNTLHDQTGQSVRDLSVLRQGFQNLGLGTEAATPFVLKLENAISTLNPAAASVAGALKRLGTSAAELRNLPLLEQIAKLQQGFGAITSQTRRISIAQQLFGEEGGKVLPLLSDPQALALAAKQAGPLAEIMQKNSASFGDFNEAVTTLKGGLQTLFGSALSNIVPGSQSIAEKLNSINFAKFGEAIGSLAGTILRLGESVAKVLDLLPKSQTAIAALSGAAIGGAIGGLPGAAIGALGSAALSLLSPSAPSAAMRLTPAGSTPLPFSGAGSADRDLLVTQQFGNLYKLGGGYANAAGGGDILSETRTQTRQMERHNELLTSINAALTRTSPAIAPGPPQNLPLSGFMGF